MEKQLQLLDEVIKAYSELPVKQYKGTNFAIDQKFVGRLALKLFLGKTPEEVFDIQIDLLDAVPHFVTSRVQSYVPKNRVARLVADIINKFYSRGGIVPDAFEPIPNGGVRQKPKLVYFPRLRITNEMISALVTRIICLNMVTDRKFWKTLALNLNQFDYNNSILARALMDCIENGKICFHGLVFLMTERSFNRNFKDPSIILHAMYIGKLTGDRIEIFASDRDQEFRKKCVEVLRLARNAQANPHYFRQMKPANISPDHPQLLEYRPFGENFRMLTMELLGEHVGERIISSGWAFAAIKKFGTKTYVQKTWRLENFYDVLITILYQRPEMRQSICKTLEVQFKDAVLAREFRQLIPMNFMNNPFELKIDPLQDTEHFLNFPNTVQAIQVVWNRNTLQQLTNRIEQMIAWKGFALVGLDAEWSSYNSVGRASILQLALNDMVFIVDLDSTFLSGPDLFNFFDFLFGRKEILKLGFQFAEDLIHLRHVARNCMALYTPQNLICINKLLGKLVSLMESRGNSELLMKKTFPFLDLEAIRAEAASAASSVSSRPRTESEDMNVSATMDSDDSRSRLSSELNTSIDVASSVEGDVAGDQKGTEDDAVFSLGSIVEEEGTSTSMMEGIQETENDEKDDGTLKQNKYSSPRFSEKDKKKEEKQKMMCLTSTILSTRGLSFICQQLFGRPLDKSEQCSVWDRRPLRNMQLRYAAMDAFSLLLIYEKCFEIARTLGLDLNKMVEEQPPLNSRFPLLIEFPL